jgi:signal transduction histidine kinase
VQRVQSAAKHLLALINNMLDLSKIEAGKMELYLEEFELAEVVEEAVSRRSAAARARGQCASVRNYAARRWAVRLDRMKVRQVLLNLLGNAGSSRRGAGSSSR